MGSPAPDWIVRAAGSADVDALLALHERAFGRAVSREHWDWKLGRRSSVPNIWVAECEGRLVFQYAGIPTRFRHRGVDVTAMVSVDTMADPTFRRRGLLAHVAATTYQRWREAGVPFVVGLPNQQWGTRVSVLGLKPIAQLRWWVRWLAPGSLLAARSGLWRPGVLRPTSAHPRASSQAGELRLMNDASDLDQLWHTRSEEGVIRDAAWVQWRYLDPVPSWRLIGLWRSGALAGAIAFRSGSDLPLPTGVIGEVVASDRAGWRALLRGACAHLRAEGAARVALLIQERSDREASALASGFLPRPGPFTIQCADLGGGAPWASHFQGGDFDVV